MKFKVAFRFEDPHSSRRDYLGAWESADVADKDAAMAEFREDHSERFIVEYVAEIQV